MTEALDEIEIVIRQPIDSFLPEDWVMVAYEYGGFDIVMQNHAGTALARNKVTGEYVVWSYSDWRFHSQDSDRGVIFNHGYYFSDYSEAMDYYLAKVGAV